MGFEPTHIGITIRGLKPLDDTHHVETLLISSLLVVISPLSTFSDPASSLECFYMVRPEGFEPPTPAFVAQCSNPNELRWCIEFESSCPIVIATIHPCNKAGRDSVRHLGFIQLIRHHVYWSSPKTISRASNPQPFTSQYLRRILPSVTSLADTYKTWCPRKESNLHTLITKQDLYH